MKKWLIATVVLVACVLAYSTFGASGDEVKNSESTGTEIIAFGDSLVAGIGSERGGGFVRMLAEDFLVPITNLGLSGDTTADGLARIEQVTRRDPKLVILLLGGNDFLRGVPAEETFKNLEEIILTIQADGAAVLLLGVRNGLLADEHEGKFRELARKHGTAYVPDVLNGIMGDSRLMSDRLHPNDAGYRIIADRVGFVLERLID